MKNLVLFSGLSVLTSLSIQSHSVYSQETNIVQLSRQEALSYSSCHPENYTDWFLVNNGADLYGVIEEIKEIYPEPVTTTITPSSTIIDEASDVLAITPSHTMSVDMEEQYDLDLETYTTGLSDFYSDLVSTPSPTPEPSLVITEESSGGLNRRKRSAEPDNFYLLKIPSEERGQRRVKRSYYHKVVIEPEPEDKVLLVFRASDDPYEISAPVAVSHFSLGLCSVPTTPLIRAKSYFELSDETFSAIESPAMSVSGNAQLNINNLQFDAHSWAVSSPLIFYRETSSGHIVGSEFSRLEIRENGRRYYGDNSIIAAGEQGFWIVKPAPSVQIDDSRFFLGTDEGSAVFALTGAERLSVNNSYFVLASDWSYSIAVAVYYTPDVEVVGNTFVSCLEPVSSEQYRSLNQPIPEDEYEFCVSVTERSEWAPFYSAFWGSLNHLNFERNRIVGGWGWAIFLNGETLKTQGSQNTGNIIENFYGDLCRGELSRYKPKGGAIGFSGLHDPCPAGRLLADTQIPATFPATPPARSTTTESTTTAFFSI